MIIYFIHTLFQVYYYLIIARILLSWAPISPNNDWIKLIGNLTDPYLNFFKKFIPPLGMIDISPIAALIVLSIIENVVIRILAPFVLL